MKNKKDDRLIKIKVRLARLAILLILAGSLVFVFSASAAQIKTWDGGGATGNWSDATNWSDDTVPASGDDVIFDGTSLKNATIDVDINVGSIKIDSGYTGTITQSDGASMVISGCAGRTCFQQNNGIFNGSSKTITTNSSGFGGITLAGGTFNGGSGDITLTGDGNANHNLSIQGGTFNSTSGTLALARSLSVGAPGAFNPNGGTVTFSDNVNAEIDGGPTINFNNLNFNKGGGSTVTVFANLLTVNGSLSLDDGFLGGNQIEAHGDVTISPSFDGGNATLVLANGSVARTVVFDSSFHLLNLIVNDPSVTINTSGSGTLRFPGSFDLRQGIVNQGGVDLVFRTTNGSSTSFSQSGGTFNGSDHSITINSVGFTAFSQSGGNFNGGAGDINVIGLNGDTNIHEFILSGGAFTSTSGTLVIDSHFTDSGGVFNANGGTVTFNGAPGGQIVGLAAGTTFNNVNFNKNDGITLSLFAPIFVTGTLALNDGRIDGAVGNPIEARGSYSQTAQFDGGSATLAFANGSVARTFAFDTSFTLLNIVLNDPNLTINTSGPGTLAFPIALDIKQGTFNQGNVDVVVKTINLSTDCYKQSGGIFNGSDHTVTINSVGFDALSMTGGVFNGGSGNIILQGFNGDTNADHDLNITGGIFTSTSGTLLLDRSLRVSGGSFRHNNGTVKFIGANSAEIRFEQIPGGVTLNNVDFSRNDGTSVLLLGTAIVRGNLALNDGTVNGGGQTLEARGPINISSSFGGGNATLAIANGTVPRTIVFDTSYKLLNIVINDPQATVNTSGTGTLTFPTTLDLRQGTFNQGSVDIVVFTTNGSSSYLQSGGIFNGSDHTVTINSVGFDALSMTGGVFNGGSGNIILQGFNGDTNADHDLNITGGIFTSTSGTLLLDRSLRVSGGSFRHNNGTVKFIGANSAEIRFEQIPGGVTLNNVDFSRNDGTSVLLLGTAIVRGNLALNDGTVNGGGQTLEARGPINISSSFGGGNATLAIANGTVPRTIVFDTSYKLLNIVINDPQATVNTSGTGTLSLPIALNLKQGTFNQGDVDVVVKTINFSTDCYIQSGGAFNGSDHKITFNSLGFDAFSMTGGAFNGGSGDIVLQGLNGDANQDHDLKMTGGTFTSTSGTLFLDRGFGVSGGTFLHNNGSVKFTGGTTPTINVSQIPGGVSFNNFELSRDNGTTIFIFGTAIVTGNLALNDGFLSNSGTIEAQSNVNIGAGFDGGGPNIFTFSGSTNQTFTNVGGANPPGTWNVNKSAGTVTAASSLVLGQTQPFNITSGTLFLNPGSSLSMGTLTIGPLGKLINDSSTTITLGGDFTNNGVISLQGGGAACPEPDTVLLRSTPDGVRRNWTGSGAFLLSDVDVKDQGGTAAITVFNGTNSGDNGPNFTFSGGCPTALAISPGSVSKVTGAGQTFTTSGGVGTRTLSIPVNNSGATINSGLGLYTAGAIPDVSDTVRVTDGLGNIADATVNVTGPANKLAFTVQPSSTTAGQPITPSIQVAIEDNNGTTVGSATNSVTIAILNNSGGGTLSGTLTKSAINGVATFDNLSINRIGTEYTLSATAGALTGTPSISFNINAGNPSQLAFLVQPQNTFSGAVIEPPVQVALQDSLGNTVTTATDAVTLSLGSNPGSSILSGTLTRNAIAGVATFDDLNLNNAGTGYTLTTASSSISGTTSLPFDIISPFVVSNTNDSGSGSLRDAILNANSTPGTQTVTFNIPGSGPFDIVLSSALPDITDSIIIDGTTQPGFAGTPMIEIDGRNVPGTVYGLFLRTDNSVIKGLCIIHFSNSNFSYGLGIFTFNENKIQGNRIGLDAAGLAAGNANGLSVAGHNNMIGGPGAGDGNVISGNSTIGIDLIGVNRNNIVQGNLIGTDAVGTSAIGNKVGITFGSSGNTITGNVISGNASDGIEGFGDSNNAIKGNLIGLNAAGTAALGNGGSGINFGGGVNNLISANRIFGNGLLGIKLGQRQVTASGPPLPNDPLDADTGANNQQNYPVLNSVTLLPGNANINGSLNSTVSSTFTLEFFSSPICDASGNGEGETFLGSANVSTNTSGDANFNVNLAVTVPNTDFITVTATDSNGNTSEFSGCKGPQATISGTVQSAGTPLQAVALKLHNATTNVDQTISTDSTGNFSFKNLPLGQDYTVTPTKTNFTFSPPNIVKNDLGGNAFVPISASIAKFTISGNVTLNSSSLGGVTVTLSGAANATTTTNSSGNYSFGNLLPGTYTVTPSLQNFSFSPASTTLTLSGNTPADFAATNLLANLPGKIAFSANGSINTMNADGSGVATVVPKTSTLVYLFPAISSNGAKLAFIEHSNVSGNETLKISNADGSGLTTLVSVGTSPPNHSMSWSPDGTKIATSRLQNGVTQLISVTVSSGAITPIVTNGVSNSQPDWSPDGTQLTFARDDSTTAGNGFAIFRVNANGTNLVKLTSPVLSDFSPTWSPDGTKIAFLRSLSGVPTEVMVMNATDGSSLQDIRSVPIQNEMTDIAWEPDGSRLAEIENSISGQKLVSIKPDGTAALTISSTLSGTSFDWGNKVVVLVPSPGVPINIGRITIGLSGPGRIRKEGKSDTVSVDPISPDSVGVPPTGFVFSSFAYNITTNATFTPPAGICLALPAEAYPTVESFDDLSLLHDESGILVDVTTSRDFAQHQICGQVGTLGSFVVAEQVNPSLSSISGLVVDQDGNPLDDFSMSLSGSAAKQTVTDGDGFFSFANIQSGGDYVVTSAKTGYTFDPPFAGFTDLSGEQTAVFVARRQNFSISGNVHDRQFQAIAGATLTLSGGTTAQTVSDEFGNYSFSDLPAGTSFVITSQLADQTFFQSSRSIDSLQTDTSGADFTQYIPGNATVIGRVSSPNGVGIRGATVTLSGGNLTQPKTILTSSFGYFEFGEVENGQTYTVSVAARRYTFDFPSRQIDVLEDVSDLNFVAKLP